MSSLFSLYHSVRTQPMWQDIWFINCYFVIGFRWKDDGKQVIASQAGSTVSTPHPQNWSLIGSHRWRGGKLSHFDRSFFCHNEMPTKIQRTGLCKLVGISLWHGFLCQNKMKLWMDCGNFSDFVLGSLIRFGKIAWRYLDLIHFPLPVRTICLIPDIGSIKGVERERWKGEERLGY